MICIMLLCMYGFNAGTFILKVSLFFKMNKHISFHIDNMGVITNTIAQIIFNNPKQTSSANRQRVQESHGIPLHKTLNKIRNQKPDRMQL